MRVMKKTRLIISQFITHIFLICFSIVTIYPVLWVFKMALSETQNFKVSINPIPDSISLKNFYEVIFARSSTGEYIFFYQLFNSIAVSTITTLLGVLLATTAAYAFSRFNFPLRRAGLMAFLVTQMFPGTMMMIPLYIIMDKLGLLNQLMGLALVYSTTSIPFCVWTLKGYFDTIPKELEESAMIDGASRLKIFLKIILPLARPAIAVTALFSFMTAWNEFILAATFMNKETSYTLPVMLQHFVGAHNTEWGHFAAGAIIVALPVVILFYFLQKNLVSGLTAGSVKG
jgi:arabinogalactan oligomer/maltooligosaccharide transport system permease protein